jgi:hypothetical protein
MMPCLYKGPDRVGYEQLRPAFDREDRVRLPWRRWESAGVHVEIVPQSGAWSTIPALQSLRPKNLGDDARQRGLPDCQRKALVAESDSATKIDRIECKGRQLAGRDCQRSRGRAVPQTTRDLVASVDRIAKKKAAAAQKAPVMQNMLRVAQQFAADIRVAEIAARLVAFVPRGPAASRSLS